MRDDQPRATSRYQLVLAIRAEVPDLSWRARSRSTRLALRGSGVAGAKSLPVGWNICTGLESFRISASLYAADETQRFNTPLLARYSGVQYHCVHARRNADVITTETSASMELSEAFATLDYQRDRPLASGDIHSPQYSPSRRTCSFMRKAAAERIPLNAWSTPTAPQDTPAVSDSRTALTWWRRLRNIVRSVK